jgi:hypothetical protein
MNTIINNVRGQFEILATGIYFVKLMADSYVEVIKLIKTKYD